MQRCIVVERVVLSITWRVLLRDHNDDIVGDYLSYDPSEFHEAIRDHKEQYMTPLRLR